MLCLSRRPEQAIRIGDSVRIQILEIRGDRVRLGIEAPREVGVDREEVWLEKRSAAGGDPSIPLPARAAG